MHHRVRQIAFSSMKKSYKNWASIDPLKLKVENSHGYGESRTYHVTAPEECEYNSIGVHFPQYPTMIPGMVTVANTFNEAKLCPRVLAVQDDCFLDEWRDLKKTEKTIYWKECGQLLAKVHQIPKAWWEPLREQLIKGQPNAAKFPEGSLAWAYMRRQCWQKSLKNIDQDVKIQLVQAVTTDHPIGKRIVTSHGDYHPGNIITVKNARGGESTFQVVDYEFSCVTHAIQDLAFGIACCGSDSKNKKMFLKAYLQGIGESTTQQDIQSLLIQAEICQLASWHSGGMLAPWSLQGMKSEEILERVNLVKQVIKQIRDSKQDQKSILESRLQTFIELQSSPIYQHQLKKHQKIVEVAEKQTIQFNQAILSTPLTINDKIQSLLDKSAWTQPSDQQLPIKIGHSSDLGLSSSFTALCWVKNEKPFSNHWYKGRNAIFMGDVDPQGKGMNWGDFKSKIFHLELRHQGRYYFGFGWDDASSERVCINSKWEHVAFVYKNDGETKEKMIFVNGKKYKNRWGTQSKEYQGDELIWLGTGNSHGIGKWEGDIKQARIYKEALNEEDILSIAKATSPLLKGK